MIYLAKAKKRRSGPDLEKYIRIERRYTTYREASRFYSIQYYRLVKLAMDELAKRAGESSAKFTELSQMIKDAEKRLAEIAVLKTHIINYSKTKDVYVAYRKAGYSKQFFEALCEEVLLHKAAKEAFGQLEGGVPKLKDLNQEYAELLQKKKDAYAEYRSIKEENKELQMAKHNLERFLNQQDEEQKAKEKQHNKNGQSL